MIMDEAMLSTVVEKVVKNVITQKEKRQTQLGVFQTMEEAIAAAEKAYKEYRNYTVAQREAIITRIRELTRENALVLAEMGVAETKMGRVEHKAIKHRLVADKTPGTEDLKTTALTGDDGLTLVEMAPYGIIGAITPSTNPSETVLCNSIGMLAAGNAVVFNPHPHAVRVSNYAVEIVNHAVLEAGGPENLVCSVEKPTMQTSDVMMKHPSVKMLVATGGPGVVKALLSSGKKAMGAGAGNPPVIVDDTADIAKAAKDIIDGCSFDNNLPCIAEKEVFALRPIAEELIHYMRKNGAYLLTGENVNKLRDIVWTEKGLNKSCVGRDARVLLAKIGIEVSDDIRCIICETEFEHTFVQKELMMPILPIVIVDDLDQAIDLAVKAEHGNRHSAHMHSKNIDNLTRFARAVETTIFVKNAPSYAGIGVGGEGHTTFTIAGPTGEGLTSARSFTRQRRCVLVDGLRII